MEVVTGMVIEVTMCKGMEVTLGMGRGNQGIMHKIGMTNIGSSHSQEICQNDESLQKNVV